MKKRFTTLAMFTTFFLSLPVAGRIYFAFTSSDFYPPPASLESTILELPPAEINVLSYNVFLRPSVISSADYTEARAEHIGYWLKNANLDVVALQEAWEPDAVSLLLKEVAHDFPYYVIDRPPRRLLKAVSGGLLVLSRWPIEETRTLVYDSCHLADCLAAKGAVHVLIRVSENARLNLVVTHLDAGSVPRDREVRSSQITQLRRFIAGIDPSVGPILVAGDFNIDSLAGDGEFDTLVTSLGVQSYNTQDLSTVNCQLESSIFCNEPVAAEQIDYVFSMAGEQRLSPGDVQIFPLATDEIHDHVQYLSDHRAVRRTFSTDFP